MELTFYGDRETIRKTDYQKYAYLYYIAFFPQWNFLSQYDSTKTSLSFLLWTNLGKSHMLNLCCTFLVEQLIIKPV